MDYKNISEWEVLTPTGWSNFTAVKKIEKDSYIHFDIQLSNGKITELECSSNHKLKLIDNTFDFAQNIAVNTLLFENSIILSKKIIIESVQLYDLINVENDNEYYSNNIVSHNCAFINKIDTLWTSVSPTLSTGGGAVILSTPNGMGNFFHKMWQEAEEGKNGFKPIKLHWALHPDRNEDWARKKLMELSYKEFGQEYACDFVASGNTLVETEILSKIEPLEPIEKRGIEKSYWIWKNADYTRNYIVSADVARGDGTDYSTFHVIDVVNMEQVAEYQSKIGTKQFGNLLVSVATEYNNALLVIENNNIGWAVLQQVMDLGYKNIYYTNKVNGAIDADVYMRENYDLVDISKLTPGFSMSSKTRPLALSKLELCFRENSITIYSKRLINELFVFQWINGKAQAQSGYNDDLVMCLASGIYVRDTALIFNNKSIDMTRDILSVMGKTKQNVNSIYKKNNILSPFKVQAGNQIIDEREWY